VVEAALILSPKGTFDRLSAGLPKGWLDWEPEILRPAVRSMPVSWDIVQAVRALVRQPASFHSDYDVFENTVIAFCARPVDTAHVSVCSPTELLWGIKQAALIAKGTYGAEVIAYVRACMVDAGVFAYPAEMAQFEPKEEADFRAAAREKAKSGGDLDSDDLILVQAAKLSQVYASLSMITAQFSDAG